MKFQNHLGRLSNTFGHFDSFKKKFLFGNFFKLENMWQLINWSLLIAGRFYARNKELSLINKKTMQKHTVNSINMTIS